MTGSRGKPLFHLLISRSGRKSTSVFPKMLNCSFFVFSYERVHQLWLAWADSVCFDINVNERVCLLLRWCKTSEKFMLPKVWCSSLRLTFKRPLCNSPELWPLLYVLLMLMMLCVGMGWVDVHLKPTFSHLTASSNIKKINRAATVSHLHYLDYLLCTWTPSHQELNLRDLHLSGLDGLRQSVSVTMVMWEANVLM